MIFINGQFCILRFSGHKLSGPDVLIRRSGVEKLLQIVRIYRSSPKWKAITKYCIINTLAGLTRSFIRYFVVEYNYININFIIVIWIRKIFGKKLFQKLL